MSSLRRIASSRINGTRSKGPVTASGKLTSSQNALRHGLLARCLVLDDESPEAFQAVLAHHIQRLQPVDSLELGLVEEMVAAWWRTRRSWAIETHLLGEAAATPDSPAPSIARIAAAFKGLAESTALPLMHRYETRLHMVYQRALHNLLLLRAAVPTESVLPIRVDPCSSVAIPLGSPSCQTNPVPITDTDL